MQATFPGQTTECADTWLAGLHSQLMIPRGFGHGFVTLTDHVEFLYKADNYYAPEADAGIRWNDPDINIEWGIAKPILSEKDNKNPFLKDIEAQLNF